MSPRLAERTSTTERILLGDEAVAQGAVDAGLTAAYGYPGTPSTEIMEHLLGVAAGDEHLTASWCANEKTAYECALGASMAGGRALVVMKHVGLNVAADPFVNSALLDLHAGLVLAVADDPGMHSSQNEQDSRFYAAMARVPCLEPATQQEAYDMTREAFELSERFRTPVMVRLVTRLCHSRTAVTTRPPIPRRARMRPSDPSDWTLLPANARRRWRVVLERQGAIEEHLAGSPYSALTVRSESRSGARSESGSGPRLGVITAGLGRNYFLEALPGLADKPSHLHVGAYPEPEDKLRRLAGSVDTILVLEEGRPILEQRLLGIVRPGATVIGRVSGHLPADGELTPDLVNRALGLPELPHLSLGGSGGPGAVAEDDDLKLPARPPQLCTGCPHRDSFTALRRALEGRSDALVTGD
ncbi:MAG: indolepyruvate ferredoxin oxidoreductase, partial [Acidobacteriota bacterium]